jgi:Family of unknown function (DUF6263)
LIQPGAAPTRPLRYHPMRGITTTSELAYDLDVKNDGQGSAIPTLVVELETTVDDVLADGTAKLRIVVVRTSVRDRPGTESARDLLRGEAAVMRGVVITEMLAPDGKVWDARIQTTAVLPDKVRAELDRVSQSLERMAMRLPSEPVGVGASWRERKALPEGGIRAISETTYTLVSITGDTVAYTNTGLSTGAPQTLEQDGTKVEVTNTHGHSEAKGTIDLSRYAFAGAATSTFTTTMNVVAPEGTPGAGSSTVEVTTAIQLRPPADPAPDGVPGVAPSDLTPAGPAPVPTAPTAPVPAGPPATRPVPTNATRSAATPAIRSIHGAHKAP